MKSEPIVEPVTREEWIHEARRFGDYSYRQTWAYGELLAERRRAVSVHVAIRSGPDLLGLADVRLKRAPFGLGGLAYVSWGPLVQLGQQDDLSRLVDCVEALRDEFVKRRRLLLRVDLQPSLRRPDWGNRAAQILNAAGFSRATRLPAERTLLLDLDRPLAELRRCLAQKWRNCLNRAEKNGLTIRCGSDQRTFEDFCLLFSRFREHKIFDVDLDAEFFAKVHQRMHPSVRFDVTLAEKEGQVVAGHVTSMLGDTCAYLLGATEREGLNSKASYVLQWSAISNAKKQGCRWYDLGGIDPMANPGVYHFKKGLGGKEVCSPGVFEATPSGLMGNVMRRAADLHYRRQEIKRSRVVQGSQ